MNYLTYCRAHKHVIAMIHLAALPGTPRNRFAPPDIVAQAVREARVYKEAGFHAVMLENMHDTPYTRKVGPEIVALMAIIAREVKALGLYCGVQVLAGCNQEALAIAHAAQIDFVRVEGFVFGHIGDEGWFDACAGELLRYRKRIGAEAVAIFTDIKKKHSSHAITADLDLKTTAEAAQFFLSDGVIVTGAVTGQPVNLADLTALRDFPLLKIIGSGVTSANLASYYSSAELFIVGSSLKVAGEWSNPPDPQRCTELSAVINRLNESER